MVCDSRMRAASNFIDSCRACRGLRVSRYSLQRRPSGKRRRNQSSGIEVVEGQRWIGSESTNSMRQKVGGRHSYYTNFMQSPVGGCSATSSTIHDVYHRSCLNGARAMPTLCDWMWNHEDRTTCTAVAPFTSVWNSRDSRRGNVLSQSRHWPSNLAIRQMEPLPQSSHFSTLSSVDDNSTQQFLSETSLQRIKARLQALSSRRYGNPRVEVTSSSTSVPSPPSDRTKSKVERALSPKPTKTSYSPSTCKAGVKVASEDVRRSEGGLRHEHGNGQSNSKLHRWERKAAVLIPLCLVDGCPSFLFTVRSTIVGSHKGQVSFPGGHLEAGEAPEDGAVRELHEEVGGIGTVQVLGQFHQMQASTWVTPVVGYIERDLGDLSSLEPHPDEVSSIFCLSLKQVMDPSLREEQSLGFRGTLPAFHGGPEIVWGLTAFMLDRFLEEVAKPVLRKA